MKYTSLNGGNWSNPTTKYDNVALRTFQSWEKSTYYEKNSNNLAISILSINFAKLWNSTLTTSFEFRDKTNFFEKF